MKKYQISENFAEILAKQFSITPEELEAFEGDFEPLPPNARVLTREDVIELLHDLQCDSWKKCKKRLDELFGEGSGEEEC